MFNGFKAFYDKNSRVLILGSFPSVKSREQGFYYGNKQNRFWKTLGQIFGENLSDEIELKKSFLKKHNIALYDIICESDLHGSSDFDLKNSNKKIADISFLLSPNTNIEKILCNGKTAYNFLIQNYNLALPIILLPSTSSANPRFNFNAWQKELAFLKYND